MAVHKRLNFLTETLLSKSKQSPNATISTWHWKTDTSLPRYLSGMVLEVDTNIQTWVEREVGEFKHSSDIVIITQKACPKLVLINGIKLNNSNNIFLHPPLSVASKARYFTPSISIIDEILSLFVEILSSPKWGLLYSLYHMQDNQLLHLVL